MTRRSKTSLIGRLLTTLIGVSLLAAATSVFARTTYLFEYEFVYPNSRSENNSQCALCHDDYSEGNGYNPYGTSYRLVSGTLEERYRAIESIDSDGSGFTNLEEINADAQPGWTVGDTVPSGVTGDLDPATGNIPPDVTNPGNQRDDENISVSLQIVASDDDGDTLTYSALGLPPGLGINTASGLISGTIAFTAVNHPILILDYNVEVTVDDGTDPVTVSFDWTIDDVNRDPVAVDDSDNTTEDTVVVVDVLANDSDADGDDLTVTSVSDPANGTVVNNGDDVTYTPDANFDGTDTFTYSISDGFGGTDTATASINVTAANDPPEVTNPADQANTETNGVSLQIVATDPDGDSLTYSIVAPDTLPLDLTINASTGLISGTVSFDAVIHPSTLDLYPVTVAVSDGVNLPVEVTFTWTIDDLNRDPEAVDDNDSTVHDTAVVIDVLVNDSDADGDSLMVDGVTDPQNGTATTDGNTVTYTPDAGYVGSDTFDYTVDDGFGGTATATVIIEITNDTPVADNDVYSTNQNTSLQVAAPGVLGNDSDADGDQLAAVQQSGASSGTATLNADGSFSYTPNAGFVGQDSFSYVATDGIADSNVATVTINVNEITVNYPPVVTNPGDQTDDETNLVNLQIDASDPDGDALSYSATGLPPSLTIDTTTGEIMGVVSFDAVSHPDLSAVYEVTVTVSDGEFSDSATFDWTVNDVNREPVAVDDADSTQLDTPVTVDVLANDSDPDGDELTVLSVDLPLNGTAGDNGDGTVTYTPNAGFTGEDNFLYTVEDGFGGTDQATVTIMVTDGGEEADVFLNRINAPKQMNLRVDSEKERRIRVFGDGDTLEQDATVTLTASTDDDGVEVEIEPSAVTRTVVPGGKDTRFEFEAEIECEEKGSYVIVWTATIDAAENADPSNDVVQAETALQCTKKKKKK